MNLRSCTIILLLFVLMLPTLAQINESDFVESPIDVLHYLGELEWNPETNFINGVVTIDILAEEEMDSFALHLLALSIDSLTVNDAPAEFVHEGFNVIITPQEAIPAGEIFQVHTVYSGNPESIESEGLRFQDYGWELREDDFVVAYANFSWQLAVAGDLATFDMQFTVPEPFTVVSSGALVEEHHDEDVATFRWVTTEPVVSPGVIITEFVHETFPIDDNRVIHSFAPPDVVDRVTFINSNINEIVPLLSDAFGDYPYEALSIIYLPRTTTAFAISTIVFVGTGIGEDSLVHEITHQWLGLSTLPVEDGDNWISEGGATYAKWLWVLRNAYWRGTLDNAFPNSVNVEHASVFILPPPSDPPSRTDQTVYLRGSYVFLALQAKVGSDTFYEIMRTFTTRFAHSPVTTEDFIAVAEEVSGEDLQEFFDILLTSERLPPPSAMGLN